KLLKDLKELAEYDQSTSTNHRILLNDNEDHPVQNRESLENSFEEIVVSNPDQEKNQRRQWIRSSQAPKTSILLQSKNHHMILTFFLCIHDDIDNLIESVLDSKLLSINSINSQRLDKKEQEVKNVVEKPAERRNGAEKSWQNFRVVYKSSISFKNTSQISLIHSIAPIESTKEPEHLLSMGYEHLSITSEIESNEVTESNTENLLPIPSKCEDNDDLDSSNDESLPDKDVPAEEFKEEIDIVTQTDDVMPSSVEYDDDDYDLVLQEVDLFLSDNSIPPGIENVANNPEGDICFLEELLIDNSILSHESSDSNFEDNPSISRPPPEPPDDNFDLEAEVISAVMEDIEEPDEHFNPGGEIFVSTNIEDIDYFPFMIVIRIFLPYLILLDISPLLLSAGSEDTIFDP
nr:hypothetical protein [Tanacetum cinerariifolium]